MSLGTVKLGNVAISRMIIGGNPFSGFSHQGQDRDQEMKHFYNTSHIKEALRQAEGLGVNTHFSRADHHVMRYLMEHWDEGGKMQWVAQTCTELGLVMRAVENAIMGGAKASYIHGGQMDYFVANDQFNQVQPAIDAIHKAGMAAGIAGHTPAVFKWAEKNANADFYMCCYYNPTPRDKNPEHIYGAHELFRDDDRQAMVETIATLSKPAIHYKVLAAGRNEPKQAFEFVAKHLRPQDAVCVGIYTQQFPDSMAENIRLLENALDVARASCP